ncbi:MAG: bifunctional 2-polyprenyl-6-hydroxyphenol methylase/3-demethylubiquinol 3-O-methyltransferase UbiG [Pseudomonadota bacterium]
MQKPRNNLAIYDDVADQWWSDDIRWVRTLKNMVPGRIAYFDQFVDWDGKKVLDLGCAGGFMSEALDDRGAQVTGIDPAVQAIEAARAHAALQRTPRSIRYDVGTGEALPYDDGSFDIVVCVDVLEHVADLAQVCLEIARVLKPGGCLCFDTINRNPLASFIAVYMAENVLRILPLGTHDPRMFIKPGELHEKLSLAGLRPGAITGLGPRGINRRGDPIFGRLPLTSIIYMGTASKPGVG